MAKAKSTSRSVANTTPKTAPAPAVPLGAEDAYDEHLPAAQALAAAAVVPLRGDASVVYANVQAGVGRVLAQESAITSQLPDEDLSVFTALPSVALGMVYAALQARGGSTRNDALQADLAEAHTLRRVLLASAEALSHAGVLPAAKVAQIRAGRGPLDTAQDLVALAALFKASAKAVAGKTPVTAAQIARAAALGSQLQSELRPRGAPRKSETSPASDVRDRFHTLVVQGYDRLWRIGALLFGADGVDANVPSLLSHAGYATVATRAAKTQRAATRATAKATKAAARAASVKGKSKGGAPGTSGASGTK